MVSSRSERGQAIILFVGIFSVILVIAAIVVDFGLWFAERRSAQRGADLAAAAGAQDLPDEPLLAFDAACDWAAANGYSNEDVDVEVFARNTPELPVSCLGGAPALACGSDCDTVRVTVGGIAPRLFTGALGIGNFKIGAVAAAGITYAGAAGQAGPDQTVILLTADGRMGFNCSSDPVGCPMELAKNAAQALVDRLLPSASSTHRVGYAPFHHCYGIASSFSPHLGCVPLEDPSPVSPPVGFSQISNLRTAIEGSTFYQTSANICVALLKAEELFDQGGASGPRQIVLVSNGENVDHAWLVSPGGNAQGDVPGECVPPTPYPSFGPETPFCSDSRPAEEELDEITWERAVRLKAEGIEIFVIGVWLESPLLPDDPCGIEALDAGDPNCDLIGLPGVDDNDNYSNERLLRCIASSPEHYRNVNQYGIPGAFEEVASDLLTRSLLQ